MLRRKGKYSFNGKTGDMEWTGFIMLRFPSIMLFDEESVLICGKITKLVLKTIKSFITVC